MRRERAAPPSGGTPHRHECTKSDNDAPRDGATRGPRARVLRGRGRGGELGGGQDRKADAALARTSLGLRCVEPVRPGPPLSPGLELATTDGQGRRRLRRRWSTGADSRSRWAGRWGATRMSPTRAQTAWKVPRENDGRARERASNGLHPAVAPLTTDT